MIQVRNLTKQYGDKSAVDHISFDIEDGKIYGFLGPNGAGKSTTMNMITGCISATSGSVTVNGKDIFKNPLEAKKHIGYLPELPPLYPDMTPHEYLTFVAEAKGVGAEATYLQVNRVMELTAITDVRDRLIGNLSKGYRQRIGIAQALLGDPDVIILDEPTVGLDPKQIIEIRDLIRELGKTKTVILSSHILAEISAVCDHIMILSHGSLVANDTPEGLERSMNTASKLTLTVKCERTAGEAILDGIDGIREYTSTVSLTDGCTDFIIEADDTADVREPLFLAFADARMPILHMAQERLTLEDIFLKLTMADPIIDEEDGEPLVSEETDEEMKVDDIPQFTDTNDTKKEDTEA